MADNKIKKIIIGALIFGQLGLLFPGLALAYLPIGSVNSGPVNPVPINDTGFAADNAQFSGQFTPIKLAYDGTPASCVQVMKAFESTDNAAQLGFSFSAIIGGSNALTIQLQNEINAYNVFLGPACLSTLIPKLDSIVAPNTYTAALKQQLLTQMKNDAQTYQAKLVTAHGRLNVASQNVWKAFLITVLLNTTKAVADQLVNKLVSSYKITNSKQYIDSVATLMYDNQFIRDNYPNSQDQLMARAFLTNPLFRTAVPATVYATANGNLGYTNLNPNDPNFYSNMARAGFAQTNPYYLQTSYLAGSDQAHSQAINSAQLLVAQGSGYKAPVNCMGSLAQQQQIDLAMKAANDQLQNRAGLLQSLQQANQLNPGSVSQADLTKAQNDYQAAMATYQNLPYTVAGQNAVGNLAAGGGNNTEGTAAIVMCEAINSPAVLVNQGIDAVFKSLNLGQYTSQNLPGFLNALSGIATQIGSSMVLGGITGTSANINENLAVGQAVTATQSAAIQTLNNNAIANMQKGISFLVSQSAGSGNSSNYTFNWSINTANIPTAAYVTVSGPGITAANLHYPISGSLNVTSSLQGTYTLSVYDGNNNKLVTGTQTTVPTTVSYAGSSGGTVAGAFTGRPAIEPRGPMPILSPRGQ